MNFLNTKNKNSEEGFVMIILLVGVVIIALIYFGTRNHKGEAQQAIEAKKQAEKTVGEVEDRIKAMNLRIEAENATNTE